MVRLRTESFDVPFAMVGWHINFILNTFTDLYQNFGFKERSSVIFYL